MANDRLYLRCKKCRDTLLIWKHYPSAGGYLWPTQGEISEWVDEHLTDCDGRQDFGADSPLEVITELTKCEAERE